MSGLAFRMFAWGFAGFAMTDIMCSFYPSDHENALLAIADLGSMLIVLGQHIERRL